MEESVFRIRYFLKNDVLITSDIMHPCQLFVHLRARHIRPLSDYNEVYLCKVQSLCTNAVSIFRLAQPI